MNKCRDCQFSNPRYMTGGYPDGVIDPNYVTCSWLPMNWQTLPDSCAFLANHMNEMMNAHTDRNCAKYILKEDK